MHSERVRWRVVVRPASILALVAVFAVLGLALGPTAMAQNEDEQEGSGETTGSPQVQTRVTVTRVTNQQLLAFEDELDDLRDQIFDAKARLLQLRDQVMYGSLAIIQIQLTHTQEVSSAFALQNIRYTLDGFEVFNKSNTDGELDKLKDTMVYEGAVLPGEHLLTIDLVFQGRGYGVFSYMNDYLFKVKSRYSFSVDEDKPVVLAITSYDKGGTLSTLKSRLRVDVKKLAE
ncbi:MAG: hypothetical protein P9M14_12100 [Candidatus Alcyoniella australis]|nr:hypothetical protein [Candidatus Alcyoniella australis]